MGRNKYVAPVYASLQDSNQHDTGVTWFCENIDFYHPVTISAVEGILGVTEEDCTSGVEKLIHGLDNAVEQFLHILPFDFTQ